MEALHTIDGVDDISNSYLGTLYANGEMKEYKDDVHFISTIATLFLIPYSCTLQILKDKFCKCVHVPDANNINKLYYHEPNSNEDGWVMYHAAELSNDDNIIGMIMYKPKFPINNIIEVFVIFTRLADEILYLL